LIFVSVSVNDNNAAGKLMR